MAAPIPPKLRSLQAQLSEAGFDASQIASPESFGNQTLLLEGPGLSIRAVCDRDDWSLELSVEAGGDHVWFLADIWRSCLESGEPSIEPHSFEEDVAFVATNLERLMRLTESAEWDAFVDCLHSARQVRGELMRRAIFGHGGDA